MRASKRSQVPLVIAKVAFTNLVDAKLAEAKLVVKRFVDFASYSPISGASSAPLRSRNPLICSGLHGIGLEVSMLSKPSSFCGRKPPSREEDNTWVIGGDRSLDRKQLRPMEIAVRREL